MQTSRIFTAALLIFACTPKSADTDGDPSSSSGVETDGAEATSATNTSPTTGVDPTITAQTTTSASDDTGPTTTDITSTTTDAATDTETGADTEGACAAAGVHLDACEPGSIGSVEQWIESCNSVEADVSRDCIPAKEAKWSCIATLSCEEAAKFQAGEPTSCTPQVEAAEAACVYQGCFGEGPLAGDSCKYSLICNGFEQSIFCEADVCTCSEDNVTVGDCPANGFCNLGTDELPAAVTACCGWMH